MLQDRTLIQSSGASQISLYLVTLTKMIRFRSLIIKFYLIPEEVMQEVLIHLVDTITIL